MLYDNLPIRSMYMLYGNLPRDLYICMLYDNLPIRSMCMLYENLPIRSMCMLYDNLPIRSTVQKGTYRDQSP